MKAPVAGLVKTRLGKEIGFEKACKIYKKFCRLIFEEVCKTGFDVEIDYYPENGLELIRQLIAPDVFLLLQDGDDLGVRMKNAFLNAFKRGYKKVLIIGSDIPEIKASIILDAFDLIQNEPVLGPCKDGGYYLIGMDEDVFNGSYFEGIKWSTESVLNDTVIRMKEAGFSPSFLTELYDIDYKSDYENFLERNMP